MPASSGQSLRYVAATLALVALALAMLVAVDRLGEGARRYADAEPIARAPRVEIARDATHAVELWRASGLRGRVLVHLGKFLHFVEPAQVYPETRLDGFPYDVEAAIASHTGDPGMLWVLMRLGVARELVNVLPPSVYTEKVEQGGRPGERSTAVAAYGLPRTIADHLIDVDEPVLVSIDASLFESDEGRGVAAALRASSLRTDLVVCNLAEDNPRVSEAARDRLRQFAAELGASP